MENFHNLAHLPKVVIDCILDHLDPSATELTILRLTCKTLCEATFRQKYLKKIVLQVQNLDQMNQVMERYTEEQVYNVVICPQLCNISIIPFLAKFKNLISLKLANISIADFANLLSANCASRHLESLEFSIAKLHPKNPNRTNKVGKCKILIRLSSYFPHLKKLHVSEWKEENEVANFNRTTTTATDLFSGSGSGLLEGLKDLESLEFHNCPMEITQIMKFQHQWLTQPRFKKLKTCVIMEERLGRNPRKIWMSFDNSNQIRFHSFML